MIERRRKASTEMTCEGDLWAISVLHPDELFHRGTWLGTG